MTMNRIFYIFYLLGFVLYLLMINGYGYDIGKVLTFYPGSTSQERFDKHHKISLANNGYTLEL